MRGFAAGLLLAVPLLAGCLGGQPLEPSTSAPSLGLGDVEVPQGASLEAVPNGAVLRWADAALPFRANFTVPKGATLVRATAELGVDAPLSVSLRHAETGRRRCNPPLVEAWNLPRTGTMTCSGLTAIDPLPAPWSLSVLAQAAERARLVEVEFLAVQLDGLVAKLDLSQLSMPVYDLETTRVETVASHDGTPLHVEVTLPKGPGPWPTVLASSPYNHADRAAGRPAQWEYFVQDWAKRGYAVAMADVRGFGESGGCVEVWGPNEQRDQASLVEWVAAQPWSNGAVGFYGQSYVGTTPVEAAVQAPEALKAIVSVAPVINAYDDWHFGGVPNGENLLSPVGYQALGTEAMLRPEDPLRTALNTGNGLCDPTLAARANDPRALYDDFYEERNFSARAANVKAAVLYTEGFEDSNVKSSMITHWFNALPGPKLGLFGHWVHQHPTRADQEVLFLAWMDQYVKGKPLGLERLPQVAAATNVGTERLADEWPPSAPAWRVLHARLAEGKLGPEPAEGQASLLLAPEGLPAGEVPGASLVLEAPIEEQVQLAGQAVLRLRASLEGAGNAHVAAFLYDAGPQGEVLATWGMVNLAHRLGHERYEPVGPGEVVSVELPLLPTEHVLEPGHTLRLVVRGAHATDWFLVGPSPPGRLTLHGGSEGTALLLPLAPAEGVGPLPRSAQP